MRVVFDFELFDNPETNSRLLDIFLLVKADINKYLQEFSKYEDDGAIIVNMKPGAIGFNLMGFEKEQFLMISEKMNAFDWYKTFKEVVKARNN